MSKSIALIIAGVLAVIVMVSGIYIIEDGRPEAYFVFAAAIAGFLWLFHKDQKRELREGIKASIADNARFNEVIVATKSGNFELKVKGSFQIGWAVLMCLMGAGFIAYQMIIPEPVDFSTVLNTLIGIILLLAGFLILFIALCAYGKPAINLSTEGVETPLYGFIPWVFVEGICLQDIKVRSARLLQLELLVPNIRQLSGRFCWPKRWVYRVRPRSWAPVLNIPLYQTSETPQVIYRTARRLWAESKGFSHDWDPLFSAEANAAIRQRSEAMLSLKRLDRGLPDSSLNSLKMGVLTQEVMHANVKMANEVHKIRRIRYWIFAVSIVAFVVYAFSRLIGA